MTEFAKPRRRIIVAAGAGLLLAGAGGAFAEAAAKSQDAKKDEKEVGAVEDLMREHGIIRRAILVYRDTASKLRAKPASVDPILLHRTATLLRAFGENYHEKKLEEEHIFPALKKAGGPAASYVDVLIAQHQRGRQVTDFVIEKVRNGAIGRDAEALAGVLDGFELMYEHHAAREDTVVFPAWKDALSAQQLDEMGDLFEEIEHKQFGKDGFEEAVAEITQIEQALGIADIAQFTPPQPPKG
jgi:hemerythrin-like domain-containing protein